MSFPQNPGQPSPFGNNPYSSPHAMGGPPPTQSRSPALAITSMMLGITSILASLFNCCCIVINLPFSIPAVVLGFISLHQIKMGTADGKGMALAGIICGFVSMALMIAMFIFSLIFPALMENGTQKWRRQIQQQQQQQQRQLGN